MRTNRHVPFFFCVLISVSAGVSVFLSAGCSVSAAPVKHAPAKPAATQKSVPPNIGGVGTGISASLPDPKRPGKLLYELRAQSINGQSDASGVRSDLNSVWVRLYQNGAASAILTAPHAHAAGAGKAVTVTGTGGVRVKSLAQPGTTMTADTAVWYAGSNQIVATGHVVYRSSKSGLVLVGPSMNYDTSLKTFQMGHTHATLPL